MFRLKYVVTLVSLIIPVFGLPAGFYGLYKDFKYWRWYSFCVALTVWAFAYSYTPISDAPDIVRYWEFIDHICCYNLSDALEIGYRGGAKVFAFLCWGVGELGDKHLISAITTFIVYYIGVYIACDLVENYNIEKSCLFFYLIFLFVTLNFPAIVNNVRNVFAFCVFGLAVYRDLCRHKRNMFTLVLYIAPLFIHSTTYVLVVARVIVLIFSRNIAIGSIAILFSNNVIDILYNKCYGFFPENIIVIGVEDAIRRAEMYFNDASASWGEAAANSWFQFANKLGYGSIVLLFCIVAFGVLYGGRHNNLFLNAFNKNLKFYMLFCYIIGLMALACLPMAVPNYWRFTSGFIVLGSCIFLVICQSFGKNCKRVMLLLCFCLSSFCFILWFRELMDCDRYNLIIGAFKSSPIYILTRDIFYY